MENRNENTPNSDNTSEHQALIHRYAIKNMLSDACEPDKAIVIDGRQYLKFRLWVHELYKIPNDDLQNDISHADDESDQYYYLTQSIELLEQKLQTQLNINNSLHQLNRNLRIEQDHIINSKNNEIAQLKKEKNKLPEKTQARILSLLDELNLANNQIIQLRNELSRLDKHNIKLQKRNEEFVSKNLGLNQTVKNSQKQIKQLTHNLNMLNSFLAKKNKLIEIHRLQLKSKTKKIAKSTKNAIHSLKSTADKKNIDMYTFSEFALNMLETLHHIRAEQQLSAVILDKLDFIINQPYPNDNHQ